MRYNNLAFFIRNLAKKHRLLRNDGTGQEICYHCGLGGTVKFKSSWLKGVFHTIPCGGCKYNLYIQAKDDVDRVDYKILCAKQAKELAKANKKAPPLQIEAGLIPPGGIVFYATPNVPINMWAGDSTYLSDSLIQR